MSDLIFQTYGDLCSAESIGTSLSQMDGHLRRVLTLLPVAERQRILRRAYESYKGIASESFSIQQFTVYAVDILPLRQRLEKEADYEVPVDEYLMEVGGRLPRRPKEVNWSQLTPRQHLRILDICAGENVPGLALALSQTFFTGIEFFGMEIDGLLKSIGESLKTPELGAAVSQCLAFNRRLIDEYRLDAAELVAFAGGISEEEFPTAYSVVGDGFSVRDMYEMGSGTAFQDPAFDWGTFSGKLSIVEELLKETYTELQKDLRSDGAIRYIESLNWTNSLNQSLRRNLNLENKFGFVQVDSGMFVPASCGKQVSRDFDDVMKLAMADKVHLLGLSPRHFEEFMADLFSRLGYNVELTKATRDGGVDIICLKSLAGIRPMKVAVEVKRYKEGRPITAQLVRSFVGANKQYEADRLVYVTTSDYTAPAMEYANKYARNLLALKDYEQIREWCDEATRQPWVLLPNSRR